jgi:hypothetical protein
MKNIGDRECMNPERGAKIAEIGHLVPTDGGPPTEAKWAPASSRT